MKTNLKKSILSSAFIAAFCSICFAANARTVVKTTPIVAVSDTGKMDKMDKMSHDKMGKMKKKKMDKMSKDKMKMAKDTSKM